MKRSRALASLCVAVGLSVSSFASRAEAEWAMKQGPLMTRFAADVTPDNVLPEYPRPQLTRGDWLNLNGVWEYQPGQANDPTPVGKTLSSRILVPFPVESAISGVMEHHDRLWYRRAFTVPAGWNGKRVLLHFDAVDYETEVFLNGKSLGTHKGGYDPFRFDITEALNGNGPQELIVKVFDPTLKGGQPRGKQTTEPGGIMYTSTTGIWQTVWLEPVAAGGIDHIKIVPDVDDASVSVTATLLNGAPAADGDVTVTVKDGDRVVATSMGKAGEPVRIKLQDPKLWSPDSPFLYDLTVAATKDNQAIDTVGSYFGMRKIELSPADEKGVRRILLNGKFTFMLGPLDQGFWPDGLYTPPSEAAIKYDLQTTKDLGFNFIRKHIKVEPARWYYWCDKLGLMVWQDMPSANSYTANTPGVDKAEFESELRRMVDHLYNVPSIVMWVPFNEGQGQHDTAHYVDLLHQLDPTRLVNQGSGWEHHGVGDVLDVHSYPPPNVPNANGKMALACGEYGGIAFKVPGHMWKPDGGGYVNVEDPTALVDLYSEFTNLLKDLRDNRGLSAAVYTQTTDVETEINGLLTYDRIPKADVKLFAKANRFEIPPPTYNVVVPTSQQESQTWRYTFENPGSARGQAPAWAKPDFDDSKWKEGPGGFGTAGTPGIGKLGTEWGTPDVWLRRTFTLPANLTPDEVARLPLSVYHDENVQVYINGVMAYRHNGYTGQYQTVQMTDEARKTLKVGGENTLAVHCHQTTGGQYVDVGMIERVSGLSKLAK